MEGSPLSMDSIHFTRALNNLRYSNGFFIHSSLVNDTAM